MAGQQGASFSASPGGAGASVGAGSPAAGGNSIDVTLAPGGSGQILALPGMEAAPAPKTPWMDIDIEAG